MIRTQQDTSSPVRPNGGGQRAAQVGALVMAVLALSLLPIAYVYANTITVNSTLTTIANDGKCTLIEAITSANTDAVSGAMVGECTAGNGADTIELQAFAFYELFSVNNSTDGNNGLPSITTQITINGNGATIQRADLGCVLDVTTAVGEFRIIHVATSGDLKLNNITIRNGCADHPFNLAALSGGGILNMGQLEITSSTLSNNAAEIGGSIRQLGGTLTIINSILSHNLANNAGAVDIFSGTFMLISSTVSHNSAKSQVGAISLFTPAIATVINSAISGNSAASVSGIDIRGTLTIINSTIADNFGTNFGAITLEGGGTVNVKNSIVANNSPRNCQRFFPSTFNAFGTNLDTDSTCSGFTLHTDPQLGPLQNNGDLTQTHALLTGSPALDAAADCNDLSSNPVMTDQRGIARPSGAQCDLGAYEATVLTVLGAGTGSGMVIDSGFNCTSSAGVMSGDCIESVAGINTIVALGVKPAAGSVFSDWNGNPDCADGAVTMDTNVLRP